MLGPPRGGPDGFFRVVIPALKRAAPWLLAGAFLFQTAFLVRDKSPVTDAVAFHLVNGYAYLKTHDFRMSPATPPLVREWFALPWLVKNPKLDLNQPAWREGDSVPFAMDFLFKQHRGIAGQLLYASGAMGIALALALGGLVWRWAGELYGPGAGLAALAFFVFCPNIVGYSAAVNIEIGISLFYFGAAYALWRLWEKQGKRSFPWLAAVLWGCALASKFTAVLLGPLFLAACVWRKGWRKGLLFFVGMSLAAFAVVWTAYFFEWRPILNETIPRIAEKEEYLRRMAAFVGAGESGGEALIRLAKTMPVPLSSWILGFFGIARSHQEVYLHYFMGQWIHHGVWYHYFFSFAVKTTLAFLAGLLIRAVWRPQVRSLSSGAAGSVWYLWLPVAVLFAATIPDSTGVGMRYLIPTLPFLFVWISGLGACVPGKGARAVLTALVLAHAALSLKVFPNQMAYFNELIGGPSQAWKFVRANDLEWGQEVKNLARYLRAHQIGKIRSYLFGAVDPSFYGINATPAVDTEFTEPLPEVYAISIYNLDAFLWAARRKPDAVIGHVIWVYDLRKG